MPNIRYALHQDLKAIRDLWQYSFADEESFISYYFDKRYDSAYNLIAYEDVLLASLQRNPYKININNDLQDTAYIVGISVYPEHRGKKLTTHLMHKALKEAYEKEEKISLYHQNYQFQILLQNLEIRLCHLLEIHLFCS